VAALRENAAVESVGVTLFDLPITPEKLVALWNKFGPHAGSTPATEALVHILTSVAKAFSVPQVTLVHAPGGWYFRFLPRTVAPDGGCGDHCALTCERGTHCNRPGEFCSRAGGGCCGESVMNGPLTVEELEARTPVNTILFVDGGTLYFTDLVPADRGACN
jgi:hypothetical protein